mgnify:CR=1 FL=1
MVTGYWGMDNWKAKYFADFRVISLADARVLLKTRCSWVTVEMLDIKKLEAADPKFDALNGAQMEEKIFANDGALLKAGLRSAAEQCRQGQGKTTVGLLGVDLEVCAVTWGRSRA